MLRPSSRCFPDAPPRSYRQSASDSEFLFWGGHRSSQSGTATLILKVGSNARVGVPWTMSGQGKRRLARRSFPHPIQPPLRNTKLCVHIGRVVINSSTRESICILNRQSRVLSTRRDHYATRIKLQARFQNDPVWLSTAIDIHDRLGNHQLRAKLLGLRDRSICEFLS